MQYQIPAEYRSCRDRDPLDRFLMTNERNLSILNLMLRIDLSRSEAAGGGYEGSARVCVSSSLELWSF